MCDIGHVNFNLIVKTISQVYIQQTTTLYILNTLKFCQLYLNKADKIDNLNTYMKYLYIYILIEFELKKFIA